jgi:hypothetical protein
MIDIDNDYTQSDISTLDYVINDRIVSAPNEQDFLRMQNCTVL